MLKMTGLCKAYRTEVVETFALREFDLSVAAGEFVALTGPSRSRVRWRASRACCAPTSPRATSTARWRAA